MTSKFWYLIIYAVLILAIYLGYNRYSLYLIFPLAIINTIICFSPLRKHRHQMAKAVEQSPILDGGFLFAQQIILVTICYLIAMPLVLGLKYLLNLIPLF